MHYSSCTGHAVSDLARFTDLSSFHLVESFGLPITVGLGWPSHHCLLCGPAMSFSITFKVGLARAQLLVAHLGYARICQ